MHTTHGDIDGEGEGGAAVVEAACSFSAARNPNSFQFKMVMFLGFYTQREGPPLT